MLRKKKGGGPALPKTDTAGPSNVINTEDNLSGLEDLAHGVNEDGIPFILVDAVACTTRSDLDKALRPLELERMEQVIKHIDDSKLPMLEDMEPPPELDMTINLSSEAMADLRAAEEKEQFDEDMKLLTFWKPDEDVCTSPTTTIHNTTEPQVDINSKIEELRIMIDKLRKESNPDPKMAAPTTSMLPGRPGLQRQRTFEIKRKSKDKKDLGSNIASSKQTQPLKPSDQDRAGANIRSSEGLERTEKPLEYPTVSSRTQQIINQVGDLLVELTTQNQPANNRVLAEGASYSYLATIRPANGSSNCSVLAIRGSKPSIIKAAEQSQNQTVSSQMPLSRNPPSNIIASPNKRRSEASNHPIVVQRNSQRPGASVIQTSPVKFPEQRSRSQLLAKVPRSFLKVPARAKHCHGRMRD